MCFPIDKLLQAALWPQTPADILLMASETMAPFLFIFFICRAPSIARATRLSSRRTDNGFLTRELLVKDVATPRSLCTTGTHIKVCAQTNTQSPQTCGHMNAQIRTHKSNLSLNQIPSFCFSDSKGGEGVVMRVVCTGKVITISSGFGVTPQSSQHLQHHIIEG